MLRPYHYSFPPGIGKIIQRKYTFWMINLVAKCFNSVSFFQAVFPIQIDREKQPGGTE